MALAGIEAIDCAFSSVCLSFSAVLMSGLGAPVRTATPSAHPGDVGRRSGRDLRTRRSVFPNVLGYDTKIKGSTARGHFDEFRRRAVANDSL